MTHRVLDYQPPDNGLAGWAEGATGTISAPTLPGYDYEFTPDDVGLPIVNVYASEIKLLTRKDHR